MSKGRSLGTEPRRGVIPPPQPLVNISVPITCPAPDCDVTFPVHVVGNSTVPITLRDYQPRGVPDLQTVEVNLTLAPDTHAPLLAHLRLHHPDWEPRDA